MDRRQIIKNTGLAGILATGVAPGIVGAQAQIRWRMTSSFPKPLDTLFGVADVFSKKVSEMTGGKFVISTHAAGEIVPAFGTIDAVQQGLWNAPEQPATTTSAKIPSLLWVAPSRLASMRVK
jgi:TRAP-type mannitol/chloroaromatic compound transport system substrate-binding protein